MWRGGELCQWIPFSQWVRPPRTVNIRYQIFALLICLCLYLNLNCIFICIGFCPFLLVDSIRSFVETYFTVNSWSGCFSASIVFVIEFWSCVCIWFCTFLTKLHVGFASRPSESLGQTPCVQPIVDLCGCSGGPHKVMSVTKWKVDIALVFFGFPNAPTAIYHWRVVSEGSIEANSL